MPAMLPSKKLVERELALFLLLLLAGLLLLPVTIYAVGGAVFGSYGGAGFTDFYATLHDQLRDGVVAVWLLVLSPYLLWQILRLSIALFRRDRPAGGRRGGSPA